MVRATSFSGGFAAFAASAVLHAAVLPAVLLAPSGHARRSPVAASVVAAEIPVESVDAPVSLPEPSVTPVMAHVPRWPSHTHPYPVPEDHDAVPHDPRLEHPHAPPPAAAPAQAEPALVAADDSPRFTMAVGSGAGAFGAVSTEGSGAPGNAVADAAPVSESDVDGKARLLGGLPPPYPDDARADGVEGDVTLEIVVDTAGAVESARVLRGIGHGLDEAAQRAVRQYHFAPATRDGRPVRVRMPWSVQFRLR